MTHTMLTTQIAKTRETTNKRWKAKRPTRPAEWSRLPPLKKLGLAYELVHNAAGKVFTLRLSRDALVTITGGADPTRIMSRRLRHAFRDLGMQAPDFAFAMEVTHDDRNELHIHGAVLVGNLDQSLVKQALRRAGGSIPGRAGSRQIQIKNFNISRGGPLGWAGYMKPSEARTRQELGQKRTTYISKGLRGATARRWNEERLGRGSM